VTGSTWQRPSARRGDVRSEVLPDLIDDPGIAQSSRPRSTRVSNVTPPFTALRKHPPSPAAIHPATRAHDGSSAWHNASQMGEFFDRTLYHRAKDYKVEANAGSNAENAP
jgi:hypothetical protein